MPAALHPVLEERLNDAVLPASSPPPVTRRDARLPAVAGKAHAVIGMRRAGKTTFLRQLQAERREALPPERVIFIGFDDDRLAGIEADQLALLLEEYYRRYPVLRGRDPVYWYLDEIQLVSGWERFVRRVMDTEKAEIVVSGSSARMLSREVHTSLRGRGMETVIGPFTFREVLRHRGAEPSTGATRWTAAERSQIEKHFREYMVAGGFPEAQGLPAQLRTELLQGYVDTVLFRDVVERYDVSQVAALRWLTRHCLRSAAAPVSAHRLYNDLRSQGHAVAKDLVHALLSHLTDAFLFSLLPVATDSERRRNSNPRKVYPVDHAMIAAFDAAGRTSPGHVLETIVHDELARRKLGIGYVRTEGGHEVDFLARSHDGTAELIQVCADPSTPGTLDRELGSLASAAAEHPDAAQRLLVLTADQARAIRVRGVQVEPAYEWLLSGGA